MPDASIVVKETDRYSETMKKMSNATNAFKGDVDKMEKTLTALSKNKVTLKMDLSKAKSELKAAEKQFDLTHSAADGLNPDSSDVNMFISGLSRTRTTGKATQEYLNCFSGRGGAAYSRDRAE